MSYLEKLLQGFKVEWKPLGEVCDVIRGKRLTKKELSENGKYPVFHGGLIPLGLYDKYNCKANQTMIINTGSIGEVVWSEVNFWSSDGTFVVKTNENIVDKFLYYFLKTQEQYFKTQKREGGVPTIDRAVVEKLQIPIPCPNNPKKSLEIQQKIVNILDTFTELTAKLTAELTARKKQYNFYRDRLLSFDGTEVEWKPLGEVLTIKNGKDYKNFKPGNIPVFGSGGIMTFIDTYVYDKPSVLIPRKGSLSNLFYVDVPFWTVDTIFWTDINITIINPKFIYYYLQTQHLEGLNMAGGIPSLTQTLLNKVLIPVPSLAEQERIVSILDKFDTLTASITEGLPKEIELRKKQYEYYRDKLLTFPKDEQK